MTNRLSTTLKAATAELRRAQRDRPRRRWYRSPVVIGTGVLMLIWCWITIGVQTLVLLGLLAVLAGTVYLVRRRRDILACIVIAVVATAAPGVAIILIASSTGSPPAAAGVLTGHILAGPLPTLVACMLRPVLPSRPLNAAAGSAILPLGAIPSIIGAPLGAVMLIASLTAGCGLIWGRHHRALTASLQDVPELPSGWVDLGHRKLPSGRVVAHLMVGRGHAICALSTTASTISPGALNRAVDAAVETARSIGLAPSRVQPVLLAPAVSTSSPRTRSAASHNASAQVPVVDNLAQLYAMTISAPATRLRRRGAVFRAAALPANSALPRSGRRLTRPLALLTKGHL